MRTNPMTLLRSMAAAAMLAPVILAAQTQLTGAGATFPAPIYTKWFDEYHKAHPEVQINYQPIGSGGGIRQVTEGTVDFGATDGPMNDTQLGDFKTKRGNDVLHFPTVMRRRRSGFTTCRGATRLGAEVHAGSPSPGSTSATITKWERSGDRRREQGREAAGRRTSSSSIALTAAAPRISGRTISPRSAMRGRPRSARTPRRTGLSGQRRRRMQAWPAS